MHVGFIGLGNVGSKLSGSLLRNGVNLSVYDLDKDLVADFVGEIENLHEIKNEHFDYLF